MVLRGVWAVSVWRPEGDRGVQLSGVWATSVRRPGGDLGVQQSGICGVCICCLYFGVCICCLYLGSVSVVFIFCFYLLFVSEEREEGGGEGRRAFLPNSNNPNHKGGEKQNLVTTLRLFDESRKS